MNNFSNTTNSQGLLKNVYAAKKKQKGPVSQMNDSLPQLQAVRNKLNSIKKI